jgi:hypothetical protein
MGFCLFRHANGKMYFAVNGAHVVDVLPQNTNEGEETCLLKLSAPLKNFEPLVAGTKADIFSLLRGSAKIGLQKVDIRIIGGRKHLHAAPMLFNQPDRIVFIREMDPSEFAGADFVTASELVMDDGTLRMMVERPGVFVKKANAGGKVPMLD